MSISSPASVEELLIKLEAAVRRGDRTRAAEFGQKILQRLAMEAAAHAGVELRVRVLLAEQNSSPKQCGTMEEQEIRPGTRSIGIASEAADAESVVYPVWFGTNRKPSADGRTFTAERNTQTTRGRVQVHVPEAHRFGETGTSFWKKLLRFDLRDDRLRVQRVEQQERDAFFAGIRSEMHCCTTSTISCVTTSRP